MVPAIDGDNTTLTRRIKIGIVAIQGGFHEHRAAFEKCLSSRRLAHNNMKVCVVELRCAADVTTDLDGVVIPGGESTTMGKFLEREVFGDRLKDFISSESKRPHVWGTCAGLILLANNIEGQKRGGQFHLGGVDVTVSRNYFGRQINSFEALVSVPVGVPSAVSDSEGEVLTEYHGVFIRAPAILSCDREDVRPIATIQYASRHGDNQSDESVIVGVEQGRIMALAFHPELTDDARWHEYFIERILADTAISSE